MTRFIGHWHCERCGYRNTNFNTYCAMGCDDDQGEPVPAHPDDEADRFVKSVDNMHLG